MTSIAARFAVIAAVCLSATGFFAQPAGAQTRSPVHYPYRADQPPGTIGLSQLQRGGAVHGYLQPVELYCPEGGHVSLETDGHFVESQSSRVRAGMLIGPVYRAKVTDIPKHPGAEVYPTVEVINRLFPPPGHEARFPIPIHITQEELELALEGSFVTRVVYLENPAHALPIRERPTFQRYYEVHPLEDPLQVADEHGRPMAILRMGSRLPDTTGQMGMQYGSPPLMQYHLPEDLPDTAPDQDPPPAEVETARSEESSVLGTGGQSSVLVPARSTSRPNAGDTRLPNFARELFQPRVPR